MRALRGLLSFILFFSAYSVSLAQDTATGLKLDVRSKKLDAHRYQIIFQSSVSKGWAIYAPNDPDFGATLSFPDSAVKISDSFAASRPFVVRPSKVLEGSNESVFPDSATWIREVIMDTVPATLQGNILMQLTNGTEFTQVSKDFTVAMEGGVAADTVIRIASIDVDNPMVRVGDHDIESGSLWAIFGLGFLGGLVALITPCVFPLIPLTVSFFTKRSGSRKKGLRNAFMYGFSIFAIYIILSIPFHLTQSAAPDIFNNLSTNVVLNIVFFVVFIFFALSFFGLYEISLPSGLANKVDSKAGMGDFFGIFFMALTLAIVSFSCTGPILGTLLVGSLDSSGGAWQLTAGMGGFGLGLALPFAVFAMFPSLLQNLPKSGGWLDEVKVVLGFVELAMAIKFLSNADLVKQWGILKREVFIGLWVIIGICTTIYLLGIFKKKDSRKRYGLSRMIFVGLFGCFTVYLFPGVLNSPAARLSLISGFPPPFSYSVYGDHNVNLTATIKPVHNDYRLALQKAAAENKPLLVDFTGWACVNCRRMEDQVWTDKEVAALMRDSLVVVSLYVDERIRLPLKDQFVYHPEKGEPVSIQTVGDKWTAFEIANFHATTQPLYALITPDQRAITYTKAYTPSPRDFTAWLRAGLAAYRTKP